MFNQLWKMGDTADFNLSTHAGQAWMNIRTPLGQHNEYPPQHPTHQPQVSNPTKHQYPPHTSQFHFTPRTHNNRSPSYYRRQQRRHADMATDHTTNTHVTSAEQADLTTPQHNTSTNTYATPADQADPTTTQISTSAEQADLTTLNKTTSTEQADINIIQNTTPTDTLILTTNHSHTTTTQTTTFEEDTISDEEVEPSENSIEYIDANTITNTNNPTIPNTPTTPISDIPTTHAIPTTILCDNFSDVTPTTPNTPTIHSTPNKHNTLNTLETTTKVTTPTHTTHTSPTIHTIYHTTMQKIAKTCPYFQKGTCKFGDKCNKWHLHQATNICPICSKNCTTLGDFKLHMQVLHDPDMPSCDLCDFKCARMGSLYHHKNTQHNLPLSQLLPLGHLLTKPIPATPT